MKPSQNNDNYYLSTDNNNSISVELELYPSNGLTILQNATYQCTLSVDECPCDACSLYWTINGMNIDSLKTFAVNATSCCGEILDDGIGKDNTTLIINGCERSENITVKCSLSNISKTSELYLQGMILNLHVALNTVKHFIFPPSRMKFVGKPGAVENLFCQSFVTHINCSWSKPKIDVDGIPVNYTLNITDDNGFNKSTNTQYSNYSYSISDLGGFGMYNISVAVVVGDGNYSLEGVTNFTEVSVTKGIGNCR